MHPRRIYPIVHPHVLADLVERGRRGRERIEAQGIPGYEAAKEKYHKEEMWNKRANTNVHSGKFIFCFVSKGH